MLNLLAAFTTPSCAPGGGGAAGGDCSPADITQIIATGAGAPEWNGVYELDGESNPPTFKQVGSKVTHELYSYGRVWRLGVLGKDLAYVAATPSVLPPLAGWGIGTGPGPAGKAPAPHLKAGPL